MMLTEWGKQLDKSCPLSEYPRRNLCGIRT